MAIRAYQGIDRRLPAFGATVLVHLLIALGWQAARSVPPATPDVPWMQTVWIKMPAMPAMPRRARPRSAPAPLALPRPRRAAEPAATTPTPTASPTTSSPAAPVGTDAVPAIQDARPGADAGAPTNTILERARRDVGAIDRALRKENRPLIVLPHDSPQIRMRKSMETAAAMAPNAWYQAPKMEELVNNTGDGTRITRIVSGTGTYCLSERSPTSSADTIEKHGKWRMTNCPQGGAAANGQEWRTARDW